MKTTKRDYVRELKHALICSAKARKTALTTFEKAYQDADLRDDSTYADIVSLMGTPNDVAEEYLETMTQAEKQYQSKSSIVVTVLLVLCFAAIVFCIYIFASILSMTRRMWLLG